MIVPICLQATYGMLARATVEYLSKFLQISGMSSHSTERLHSGRSECTTLDGLGSFVGILRRRMTALKRMRSTLFLNSHSNLCN